MIYYTVRVDRTALPGALASPCLPQNPHTQFASTAGFSFVVLEKTVTTRQAVARISRPEAELQTQRVLPGSPVYCAGLQSPDGTTVEYNTGSGNDRLSADDIQENKRVPQQQSTLRYQHCGKENSIPILLACLGNAMHLSWGTALFIKQNTCTRVWPIFLVVMILRLGFFVLSQQQPSNLLGTGQPEVPGNTPRQR